MLNIAAAARKSMSGMDVLAQEAFAEEHRPRILSYRPQLRKPIRPVESHPWGAATPATVKKENETLVPDQDQP